MACGVALRGWLLVTSLATASLWALEAQAHQTAPAIHLSVAAGAADPLTTLPGSALAWFGLMASVIAVQHSWTLLSAADPSPRR